MQSQLNWVATYDDGTTITETEFDAQLKSTLDIDRDKLKEFRLIDSQGNLRFVYFNQKNRKLIFRRRPYRKMVKEVFIYPGFTQANYIERKDEEVPVIQANQEQIEEVNKGVEENPARFQLRYVCPECYDMVARGQEGNCSHESPKGIIVFDTETENAFVQAGRAEEHFVYLVGWHENIKGVSVKSLCYIYEDGHIEFDDSRNDLELTPVEEF